MEIKYEEVGPLRKWHSPASSSSCNLGNLFFQGSFFPQGNTEPMTSEKTKQVILSYSFFQTLCTTFREKKGVYFLHPLFYISVYHSFFFLLCYGYQIKTKILHSKTEDLPCYPKSTNFYPPSLFFFSFFFLFFFNIANLVLLFLARILYRHLMAI